MNQAPHKYARFRHEFSRSDREYTRSCTSVVRFQHDLRHFDERLVKLLTSKFGVFASYFLGNVRSIRVIVHFVLHIEGRRRSEQTNFVHFGTCPFGSSGLDKSPRASHVSRREHVLIYICNANHVFFYGCHPLSRFLVLFLLWKYLTRKYYTTKCAICQ